MAEINRRLTLGADILYPITKASNVIELNKRIAEATAPVVGANEPELLQNIIPAWFDTSEMEEEEDEEGVESDFFANSFSSENFILDESPAEDFYIASDDESEDVIDFIEENS